MANYDAFTVYMYTNELEFLKWLVLQKSHIETGGDLFGLWQSQHIAVVQFILGPGKNCSRTLTSFHQDVEYLGDVGHYLTSRKGLCNIGEWHSHHRIGLASPSGGDQNTVWSHMPSVSGGRFLLFIANIEGSVTGTSVKVGCFMFNSETDKMTRGHLEQLPSCSPLRHSLDYKNLKDGSEENQDWDMFCYSRRGDRHWWLRNATVNPTGSDIELGRNCACVCKIKNTNQRSSIGCCVIIVGLAYFIFRCFRSGVSKCLRGIYRLCTCCYSGLVALRARMISFRRF